MEIDILILSLAKPGIQVTGGKHMPPGLQRMNSTFIT